MAGWIQHHPNTAGVAVGRLPRRHRPTKLDGKGDGLFHVVHLNLEVEHLRQFALLLRPNRCLVPVATLDVEMDAALGVEQLCPPAARSEIPDLEPQKSFIEVRNRSGPLTVDRHCYEPIRHKAASSHSGSDRRSYVENVGVRPEVPPTYCATSRRSGEARGIQRRSRARRCRAQRRGTTGEPTHQVAVGCRNPYHALQRQGAGQPRCQAQRRPPTKRSRGSGVHRDTAGRSPTGYQERPPSRSGQNRHPGSRASAELSATPPTRWPLQRRGSRRFDEASSPHVASMGTTGTPSRAATHCGAWGYLRTSEPWSRRIVMQ